MKRILLAVLTLYLIKINYSFDTVSTKYFPLAVGNSWTYYFYQYQSQSGQRVKYSISSSSVMNGHVYYSLGFPLWTSNYIRIDSVYARLLTSTSSGCSWLTNELLVDSLSSRLFDSCKSYCTAVTYCKDTSSKLIFGQNRQTKTFFRGEFEHLDSIRYIKGIGLTYYLDGGSPFSFYYSLIGCVINGIVYGDTSLAGVNRISSDEPKIYNLYQNYPNPFNPSTKIKLDVPLSRGVPEGQGVSTSIKIYNILGREVATLVNEKLSPGSYEVTWDASAYPNGVYFYKLVAGGNIIDSKKMILLK